MRIYLLAPHTQLFTDNYDHPMYEDGKLLKDMVYLKISKNG